jgi:DNA-binding NarL/FixJ family response regulator
MKTARALLANQSSFRRGRLLAAISNQPDIEIVDELEDACDIQKAVARLRPDWVVVTHEESGGLSRQCYEILEEYPQTKIVSISSCRNSATLCWASLIMHSNQMEPTQKNLLGALRGKLQFVRALPSRPQLFR